MWYVYIHFKPNGRPFYVGKGLKNRAFSLRRPHNEIHCRILQKYGEENVRVMRFVFGTHDEAKDEEIRIIKNLRDMGILISNMTDGGDGTPGRKMDECQRRRNKELKLGNVYMLGKNHSTETKEKMRAARVKYFQNPENREKHKSTQRNKKFSPSFSSKMSNIRSQMKWITNGEKNKQIKKLENVPVGWRPGRILKKER